MGARTQAGHALAVRGAGTREPGPLRVPADELRPTGVPRLAGARASACVPRQGAGVLDVAFHGQGRLLVRFWHCAYIYPRPEIDLAALFGYSCHWRVSECP